MTDNPTSVDNGTIITEFLALFTQRDAGKLAPYFDEDIVFENYGDPAIKGRDRLVSMWAGVFANMAKVDFTTVHQAVDGDIVIAEQIHGLALPGRPLAPIRNMAVYRLRDGRIIEWRDYTNSEYARTLL
ncbi:nuclear transport factor 2 family protein [Streptomyces sp. NPDC006012]|uniref:nuclear transport factor 2 family protein n=1 Tax=Streptomyces sp. NPDC006012 TaxID=3364739 RepID=UPI00367BB44A